MLSPSTAKRTTAAVLLAVALGGASIFAVAPLGFGADPVPDSVAFEPRRAGDAGTYQVTWSAHGETHEADIRFEWGEPGEVTGPGGDLVPAAPLRWQVGEDIGTWWLQSDGRIVVSETGSVTSSENGVTERIHRSYPGDAFACLVVQPLQGQVVPTDRAYGLPFPCRLPGDLVIERPSARVVADALEPAPLAGLPADGRPLALAVREPGGPLLAWHVPDIPVALRFVTDHDAGGFDAELVAFAPGTGTVIPSGPGVPTGSWPLAPSTLYGPVADADFGWLPEDAFQAALTSTYWPDLGLFIREHPDAFVFAARYQQGEPRADGRIGFHAWRFHVTDGTDTFEFEARIRPVDIAEGIETDPVPEFEGHGASSLAHAAPAHQPASAFSWATLRDALDRHAPPRGDERYAMTWAILEECQETCSLMQRLEWTSTYQDNWGAVEDPMLLVDPEQAPLQDFAFLAWDDGGALTRAIWHQSDGIGMHIDPGAATAREGPVTTQGGIAPSAVDATPDLDGVIAIGLVAALVGAGYFAWPTLRRAPVLLAFTRLGEKQILAHPTRRCILEAIDLEPGIHFADLARATTLSFGVLDHHLKKLLYLEEVVAHEAKGYTCYFRTGSVDRRIMRIVPVLKSDGARRILLAVRDRPGMTISEVAVAAGVSLSVAHHHLKRIEACGLVRREREGQRVRVSPEPLAREALAWLTSP